MPPSRDRKRSRALFWEYGRQPSYLKPAHPLEQSPNLAVRDGDWKLLINDDGTRPELYNLSNTDQEYNNIAGKHPDITQRLSDKLLNWRKSLPELPNSQKITVEGEWKKFALKKDTRLSAERPRLPATASRRCRSHRQREERRLGGTRRTGCGLRANIAKGKPVFDIRFRNELFSISGKQPLPQGRIKLSANWQ